MKCFASTSFFEGLTQPRAAALQKKGPEIEDWVMTSCFCLVHQKLQFGPFLNGTLFSEPSQVWDGKTNIFIVVPWGE